MPPLESDFYVDIHFKSIALVAYSSAALLRLDHRYVQCRDIPVCLNLRYYSQLADIKKASASRIPIRYYLVLQRNGISIEMLQYMITPQMHPSAAANSQYLPTNTQIFSLYISTGVSTLCMRQHKPCQLLCNTTTLLDLFSIIHLQLYTPIGHACHHPQRMHKVHIQYATSPIAAHSNEDSCLAWLHSHPLLAPFS